MKFLKIIILIVTLEFSLTLKLSSKSQDLLVNCIKLRDELGSEIDCMKIIKKEIARQKSLEDGENGNEMKNEFDSLEKAVETEINNLNELKKRMSIFRKKFFQPKIDNNNNGDNTNINNNIMSLLNKPKKIPENDNSNDINLEELEKKLAMLKGNPITI